MARTTIDRRDNGRYRVRYQGPNAKWGSRFCRKVDAQRWLTNELVKLDRCELVSSCRKKGLLSRLPRPDRKGTQ